MDQGIEIADMLLPECTITHTEDKNGKKEFYNSGRKLHEAEVCGSSQREYSQRFSKLWRQPSKTTAEVNWWERRPMEKVLSRVRLFLKTVRL